jgi:hypothetical protein
MGDEECRYQQLNRNRVDGEMNGGMKERSDEGKKGRRVRKGHNVIPHNTTTMRSYYHVNDTPHYCAYLHRGYQQRDAEL